MSCVNFKLIFLEPSELIETDKRKNNSNRDNSHILPVVRKTIICKITESLLYNIVVRCDDCKRHCFV